MKILIFSHKSDIDGMGGVVLAKLAFSNVDYVLCETFNLQNEIKKYYDNNNIYNYDLIFITDMWLEEPMLSKIANDLQLKNKLYVFDHHESAANADLPFITLKISEKKGLCSGTSLFYDYLIKNKYLTANKDIKDFVELTRRYDTWEWKTKYHDENSHKLSLLFDAIGSTNYINIMVNKFKRNNKTFSFNDVETKIINNKLTQIEEKIKNYSNKIYYKDILNYKAGIIFIEYEYRNDLAEYIRQNKYDIDFVMLISFDYGTISYRSIKDNVNVRKISEAFGGKGHDKAASSPISDLTKNKIIDLLISLND